MQLFKCLINEHIPLIARGFCIGIADVIPGVSGGTIAFILGIYQRLIKEIGQFNLKWFYAVLCLDMEQIKKPSWGFLSSLAIGMLLGLFTFTHIIPLPELTRTKPALVYSLFSGLIVGSLYVLYLQLNLANLSNWILILAGISCGAVWLIITPLSTPETSVFIFFCGFITASAMLLPGLSGSFILLMMKKYMYIFAAISVLNWTVIIPFACGMVIGIMTFSRIMTYMLEQFYQQTILFIFGLLLSSLYLIWPFQHKTFHPLKGHLTGITNYLPTSFTLEVFYALCLFLLGLCAIVFLHQCQRFSKAEPTKNKQIINIG